MTQDNIVCKPKLTCWNCGSSFETLKRLQFHVRTTYISEDGACISKLKERVE